MKLKKRPRRIYWVLRPGSFHRIGPFSTRKAAKEHIQWMNNLTDAYRAENGLPPRISDPAFNYRIYTETLT